MRKLEISINNKNYTLMMNRESIKWLEANGFNAEEFNQKPITFYDLIWTSLFIVNHKEVNNNLAIKLLETYQKSGKNVSLIISFAIEEYQSFMSCPNRYKYEKSSNKEQDIEESKEYKSLTTWFYELLPMAILYGMSIDEFWNQDPDLFWAYRYAYFERLEIEQSIFNYNAWLQGAYFHEALSVSLCNAFSKQKAEYSKKPYDLI